MTRCRSAAAAAILLLAACQSEPSAPVPAGNVPSGDSHPYDGITEEETLRFLGNEPFWGGQVTGRSLTYTTPENQGGEVLQVERFAGRGGISFSGELGGEEFTMTVTPLSCSDGMSDRTYPFTVTLMIGEDTRNGCGWTERQPFEGPANP